MLVAPFRTVYVTLFQSTDTFITHSHIGGRGSQDRYSASFPKCPTIVHHLSLGYVLLSSELKVQQSLMEMLLVLQVFVGEHMNTFVKMIGQIDILT